MTDRTKPWHGHKWMPVIYCTYFGILQEIAREHGYNLLVHGSMIRDFDLVAVPWGADPKPHEDVMRAFRKALGSERADGMVFDASEPKAHGRMSSVQSGGGGYFDLSFTPASSDLESARVKIDFLEKEIKELKKLDILQTKPTSDKTNE